MRAVVVRRFGGPDVLDVGAWPEPVAMAGHVVVRLHAAGVNPVDTYIRAGQYATLPELPYVPGTDGAGVVRAVGEGVARLHVGDRVYVHATQGTYAESVLVPEVRAWELPEGIGFEAGAAVAVPYLTAHRALCTIGLGRAGEWLLVHGASGGVGVAAVQMAVGMGLRVIATASTAQGRRRAIEDGALYALGHEDHREVLAATGGLGVDLILEMAAHRSLAGDLDLLAPDGRVVVVGSRGPSEIVPRALMQREASIRAVFLHRMAGESYERSHRAVVAGLRSGVLRPVVDRVLDLSQAGEGHEAVLQDGKVGKIVLHP